MPLPYAEMASETLTGQAANGGQMRRGVRAMARQSHLKTSEQKKTSF